MVTDSLSVASNGSGKRAVFTLALTCKSPGTAPSDRDAACCLDMKARITLSRSCWRSRLRTR